MILLLPIMIGAYIGWRKGSLAVAFACTLVLQVPVTVAWWYLQ